MAPSKAATWRFGGSCDAIPGAAMATIRSPEYYHQLLMKTLLRRFRLLLIVLCTGTVMFFSYGFVDDFFEVSKNLDIFSTLYREVNMYYVDPTDPGKLMKKGIEGMLESLDPYTNFIPESDIEDYRFMTTGHYGGIGALIRTKGDYVVVTDPYEGFPAQKSDLRAGDEILEIDGKIAKGKKTDEISRALKGSPGTTVKLLIRRNGESAPLEKVIMREEIKVKNVPYFDQLEDGIGYIKLSGFTENASREVADAMKSFKAKGPLHGIILDLRGNPGGLLQEAVNISNVFVSQGQEIVSTRGKVKEMDKSYKGNMHPLDTSVKLVVLVNSGSASASEIVSGSLQDMDRAVILGQRTYGKGLVQTTRPLSYNTQLKVTTAKYYIPSGRCIQAMDYTNRNADGSVGKIPDSLMHEFRTRAGRKVYDGGGILPDVVTSSRKYSNITTSLLNKNILFDYASHYRSKNQSIAKALEFRLGEDDWKDFLSFLNGKEYDYKTKSELSMDELRKNAEDEAYLADVQAEYDALKIKLSRNKALDLERNKTEILQVLEEEIVARYYFQSGRTSASLSHDAEISTALQLLKDQNKYASILKTPGQQ